MASKLFLRFFAPSWVSTLVFCSTNLFAIADPGIYPFSADTDLPHLGKMIDGKEIVALGEATHGTASFLAEKARMTRYLIEEKGFRILGFETGWIFTQSLSEYLETCTGTRWLP